MLRPEPGNVSPRLYHYLMKSCQIYRTIDNIDPNIPHATARRPSNIPKLYQKLTKSGEILNAYNRKPYKNYTLYTLKQHPPSKFELPRFD